MPDTRGGATISILIAARNEEATIRACLQALVRLDYPTNQLDILIGDDQSTDATAAVVADFITDKPTFRLVTIFESLSGLRGKANVLAQLARQARGQYLFFTDADTLVAPDWLTDMRVMFTDKVGIVTGVTLPEGPRLFHKLQTIDWLYNLTLTHLLSSFGLSVTAMGNNMAVTREAYDAVGGYESLPFSVVEDYTLFQAIVGRGFGFRNLLNQEVLAWTKPVDTLRHFLDQRQRWMRGATALPVWMVTLLYVQYLAGPLLMLLGWFVPVLAVGLYVLKLFVQTLVISFGLGRLQLNTLLPYALLFDLYQLIIGPVSVVYYLSSNQITWKGRNYR